jgi:uncharacterized membrane protein YphA (DoxX/SURF4 family)
LLPVRKAEAQELADTRFGDRALGLVEYPLFWGLILFAIALRGGGPYSLDRKLGREL